MTDYAEHIISENQSYVLIHFAGQVKPLRFKGQVAERVWQKLERSANTMPLIEKISN